MLNDKIRIVHLTFFSLCLFIFVSFNANVKGPEVIAVPKNPCPEGPILTVIEGGNTANNIWEYLSVFAISRLYPEKKFQPYVPDGIIKSVKLIFESVSIPALSTIPKKCHPTNNPLVVHLKDPPSVVANVQKYVRSVTLDRYSSRYDEIIEYGLDKVKKELRFRKHDVEKANRMLDSIRRSFGYMKDDDEPIFVCAHYRGGDYTRLLLSRYSNINGLPTFRYYNKAIQFFKKKYDKVIFILISTDQHWIKKNAKRLHGHPIVNPNINATKVDDLVLLSHCNHSIINYGTFGVTAAIMAGGTTVVYDLGIPLDHTGMTVALGIAEILPNWMKMDEKSGDVDNTIDWV